VKTKIRNHAKKILVPHKENNYRPHLIRLQGIIAVLVIALLAQVFYSLTTTGHVSVLSRSADISTADLLADTNKQRRADQLSDLTLNDALSQAAFLKAKDMLAHNYWAHTSPSGVEPWKWFGDVGYNYSYAGENLAKNYPTADATVAAWMRSTTHRENILNEHYLDVGFAVVTGVLDGQNTTLVVALYGAEASTAAVQAASVQNETFSAPAVSSTPLSPLTYFGSAVQALNPVTIAVLSLLGLVAFVGVVAHHYRKQLPKAWQRSWRLHHGMYTFVGMIALGVLIIIATGAGQI